MTPQFLRSEASRFREMAETTDREASRQRLLAMALDYESRAASAEDQPTDLRPDAGEPTLDTEPTSASEERTTRSGGRKRLSLGR